MRKISNFVPLICVSILFAACSKFSNKPIIRVSEPFEHMHFSAGTTFDFKAKFTDNKSLSSYHFCISDAAGNTHTDFDVNENGDISGKEHTYDGTVQAPANAEGTYYLHFIVVDNDGKSKELFHEFHVDQ